MIRPTRTIRQRRAPSYSAIPKAYNPIFKLWILRLIKLGGGLHAERRNRSDISRAALEAAGLGTLAECSRHSEPAEIAMAEARFRRALAEAEAEKPTLPSHTLMSQNLARLGESAGLSIADQTILHFVVLGFLHPGLENALEQMGSLSTSSLHALLARVLGLKPSIVSKALDPRNSLGHAGLLTVNTNSGYQFKGKIDVLCGLSDQLSSRHQDTWDLFRNAFIRAPEPGLQLSHYPHATKDLDILVPYLKEVLRSRRKGVNFLIHGTPGTGKTQLVRALASEMNADLFEVASEDHQGGPLESNDRFRGYQLAQAVLGRQGRNLIFFDEIEDVFRPNEARSRFEETNVSGQKAWVNKVLEENTVPAFWVTNHLHVLDEAYIRRFDYVLRLDNPPRSVRRRMLEENLGRLPVDADHKNRLAEHEGLSPAIINRAARVVQIAHPAMGQTDAGPTFSHVLGNALEALGHSRTPRQSVEVVTDYRPELVNTDCDLSPALVGLREHGGGRICFYGPPGTGKTAYGRHLAEQLDRPLLLKRASDLLSMWVGGTEKNLAAMFEEARTEGAVLLLDEADGFLQERGSAQHNWEVTQVNEMLTQMEAFNGIFIASTNLMDRLDSAALRRFDLKVRFDYLRPEQAWVMFQDAAGKLGIEAEPCIRGSLARCGILTPGDFATILRQARMNRPKNAQDLLARLEAECQVKPDHRRKPIGFTERTA